MNQLNPDPQGGESSMEIGDMKQAILAAYRDMEVLPVVHAGHFGDKPHWEVFADRSDEAKTIGIGETWTAAVLDAYKRLPKLQPEGATTQPTPAATEGIWTVSARVPHPDYLKEIEHELWQVGGAFAEIKLAPVPSAGSKPQEEVGGANKCTYCIKESVGICEACEFPICEDHESGEYEDVYTCKDAHACSNGIDLRGRFEKERGRPTRSPNLHLCKEWDFLPIDESCEEWRTCICNLQPVADGRGLPLDVSDEDMERVERETAPLLREGLIQLIALLQGQLALSQEALSLDKEQLANRDKDRVEKIAGLLDEIKELRANQERLVGEMQELRQVVKEYRDELQKVADSYVRYQGYYVDEDRELAFRIKADALLAKDTPTEPKSAPEEK